MATDFGHVALVVVFGVGACSKMGQEAAVPPGVEAGSALADAAPFRDAAPPAPAASAAVPGPVRDSGAIVLPRYEDACASDAECGMTMLDVDGPTTCCFRCCSAHGGRKSWTVAVEAICKTAPKDACAMSVCACPMPPSRPKCVGGRCTLVF